jgi:hypothetical protein
MFFVCLRRASVPVESVLKDNHRNIKRIINANYLYGMIILLPSPEREEMLQFEKNVSKVGENSD